MVARRRLGIEERELIPGSVRLPGTRTKSLGAIRSATFVDTALWRAAKRKYTCSGEFPFHEQGKLHHLSVREWGRRSRQIETRNGRGRYRQIKTRNWRGRHGQIKALHSHGERRSQNQDTRNSFHELFSSNLPIRSIANHSHKDYRIKPKI